MCRCRIVIPALQGRKAVTGYLNSKPLLHCDFVIMLAMYGLQAIFQVWPINSQKIADTFLCFTIF